MSLDSILRNAATIAVEVGGVAYIALSILSPMAPAAPAAPITPSYYAQQASRPAIAYQQKAERGQYQDGLNLVTPLDATPPQGTRIVIPRMTKNVSGEVLEEAEKLPPNVEYEKLKKEAMESLEELKRYESLVKQGFIDESKPLSEVAKWERARYELGKLVEEKFGKDGYNELEMYVIRGISEHAGFSPEYGYVADLKKMVENETYRSNVVYARNGRLVQLLVLSSDPNRAEWYFKAFEDIIPLAEDYTGLKYPRKVLTVYSPAVMKTSASANEARILTTYPNDISSIWADGSKYIAAHEFDHVLSLNRPVPGGRIGLPVWLSEGKADITGLAVLNGGNLPSWDGVIYTPIPEKFSDYYNRRANNLGHRAYLQRDWRDSRSYSPSGVWVPLTDIGELILLGLVREVGPDYLRAVIREVNATARNEEFVSSGKFAEIAIRHAPRNLESRVRQYLRNSGVID